MKDKAEVWTFILFTILCGAAFIFVSAIAYAIIQTDGC